MAKFEEDKVINALHPEKAEVGKKYWRSSNLLELKRQVEENIKDYIGELVMIIEYYHGSPFRLDDGYNWEFIYPYEELPITRDDMTDEEKELIVDTPITMDCFEMDDSEGITFNYERITNKDFDFLDFSCLSS